MSVTEQSSKVLYAGDGVNREFDIPFRLLKADDLRLVVANENKVETEITGGFEIRPDFKKVIYPVIGGGQPALPAGWVLAVFRKTPLNQEISLQEQAALSVKTLEDGYDKVTLQLQDLAEQTSRALKVPVTSIHSSESAEDYMRQVRAEAERAATSSGRAAASAQAAMSDAAHAQASAQEAKDQAALAAVEITNAKNNAVANITEAGAANTAAVHTAKTDALTAVDTAKTDGLNQLAAKKTDALTAVDTAKTEAAKTVQAEGTQQVTQAREAAANSQRSAQACAQSATEAAGSAAQAAGALTNAAVKTLENVSAVAQRFVDLVFSWLEVKFVSPTELTLNAVFQAPCAGRLFAKSNHTNYTQTIITVADTASMSGEIILYHVDASVGTLSGWVPVSKGKYYRYTRGSNNPSATVTFYPYQGA